MQNFIGISRAVDSVRSNAGSALKTVQRTFEETALKAAGLGEEEEALYRLNKRTEAFLRAVDALQQASWALSEDFSEALGDRAMRDAARSFGDKSRMVTAQHLATLNKDLVEPVRQASDVADYATRQHLLGKALSGLLESSVSWHGSSSTMLQQMSTSVQGARSANAQPKAPVPPRAAPVQPRAAAPLGATGGVATPPVARGNTTSVPTRPPAAFDDLIGGMDGNTTSKVPAPAAEATGVADLLDFGLDSSWPPAAPGGPGPAVAQADLSSSNLDFDLGAAFGAAPSPTSTTQASATAPADDGLTLGGLSWPSKEEEDESCIRARVEAWQAGKNLRTMLVSLHEVAPSGAGWVPVKLGDVVEPAGVKSVYRKAVLAVHPDKQQGQGAQQLGHFVFEALREQWNVFRSQEKV